MFFALTRFIHFVNQLHCFAQDVLVGGGEGFCALITAKKNYKHCLIFWESERKLRVMYSHSVLHFLWTGRDEVSAEWEISKRVLMKEKQDMVEMWSSPNLPEVMEEMSPHVHMLRYFQKSSNFSTYCFLYELERLPLSVPSVKWSLSKISSSIST